MDAYREANRRLWDEWTELHWGGAYDVEGFKRGEDRLEEFEPAEIGDVRGRSLLHLQCHFGMDTLAWARRGAIVTGADFSAPAIGHARELARELGIEATFLESELYELPERLEGEFDFVYTSRGVLAWLPDVDGWAGVIEHFLKPGGVFYITEFHPVLWTLEDEGEVSEPLVRYPYFSRAEPIRFEVKGSYADRTAKLRSTDEYGWPHGLGEIVTALARRGLRIDFLNERPYSVIQSLPFLEQAGPRRWELPKALGGELPLMFSLRATKPPKKK